MAENWTDQELIDAIDAFQLRWGAGRGAWPDRRIGVEVNNESSLVFTVRRGRGLGPELRERLLLWLRTKDAELTAAAEAAA